MAGKFDKLIIDSARRLVKLRKSVLSMAWFDSDDQRCGKVSGIIREIAAEGDAKLAEFTERFDGVKLRPEQFLVERERMVSALDSLDGQLKGSIEKAVENVRCYQSEIFLPAKSSHPGVKYTPVERVGVCVPGASAPLPSTVIMTVVPAQVAGVKEIAVISPPRFEGSIHPVILAVCEMLGVREVYRVGGAQAVAALGLGTDTIKKVDKIVGPGNQWVQTAKKQLLGRVGIDSIAGPSEVLVIADESANPAWVAADMLSQAEHDPGCALVFTDSAEFAKSVTAELGRQVPQLDRAEQTEKCLLEYSGICVFNDMEEIIESANVFAAEHLQIQCGRNSRSVAERINNAGAIFIGPYSPVATGDYFAGPSHTLPTGMSARFFNALSSNDFVKASSIIEYSADKLNRDAADIIRLAEIEGLDAHAKSVSIRLNGNSGSAD